MKRCPILTLAVLALVAIVASWPAAGSVLVYDRERTLSGELWRIITCNLVHFSRSHFAYNVLTFGLVGCFIESRAYRGFGWVCLLCPVFIGLSVFLTRPNLQFFGGLSGLATAAVVLLALHGLREHHPWPCIGLLTLGAIALKIAFEFNTGELAFARSSTLLMKPVPESHVVGALCAVVIWSRFQATADFAASTRPAA